MENPDYEHAIRWIAFNSHPEGFDTSDPQQLEAYITLLVADLFSMDVGDVTKAVAERRQNAKAVRNA